MLVECAAKVLQPSNRLCFGGQRDYPVNLTSADTLAGFQQKGRRISPLYHRRFCIAPHSINGSGVPGAASLAELGCLIPIPPLKPWSVAAKELTYEILRGGAYRVLVCGGGGGRFPTYRCPAFPVCQAGGRRQQHGIDKGSVVRNPRQLARRISTLTGCWGPSVCAQFLPV